MVESNSPSSVVPRLASTAEANDQRSQALLRECFRELVDRLHDAVRTSLHATNDLFDFKDHVSVRDVADFRAKRDQWFNEYEALLRMLYARRIGGTRRSGRRPDPQSDGTIQLLDPVDQEMQLLLTRDVNDLQLATGVELAALSRRVAMLLGEKWRPDFDNPFDPQYVLDAIGAAARTTYKNPFVWRALMRRLISDITPVLVKAYIAQNRFLADQNVLPQIKAELRSRSPHRPAEDRELLHAFGRLVMGARAADSPILPIVVPPIRLLAQPVRPAPVDIPAATTPLRLAHIEAPRVGGPASPPVRLPDEILRQALTVISGIPPPGAEVGAINTAEVPDELPSLDPLMALGTSRALVSALSRLQRLNLPEAIVRAAPPFGGRKHDAALVPCNVIPYLRTVLAGALTQAHDAMVMDFVALLFDYVFRDPSIPQSLHSLFERLQVPIVRTAIVDSEFFTRHDHPARMLLDGLAEASIGASAETLYFRAFEAVATEAINEVCHYTHLDVSVYAEAVAALNRFIADDQRRTADALAPHVADAIAAEQRELGRGQAHALVRDRLAGIDVPAPIRMFAESVWVDYLTLLRQRDVVGTGEYRAACATLDDLLWSLTAKERYAQRRRLAAMIPPLVVALQQGCIALGLPREQTGDFFEALFHLHLSVLKRTDEVIARFVAAGAAASPEGKVVDTERSPQPAANKGIDDFVSEMIVGSWIAFVEGQRAMVSRLWWVSPMRTRYVFTDRAREHQRVLTPEELTCRLEAGTASVVVEPIPMFDRAVSAVFDAVAGNFRPTAMA